MCREFRQPTLAVEKLPSGMGLCHFGKPGSLNDNMIDISSFFTEILEGNMLLKFEVRINRKIHKHLYFLVDRIYPHYLIFVSTITEASTKKDKPFSRAQ